VKDITGPVDSEVYLLKLNTVEGGVGVVPPPSPPPPHDNKTKDSKTTDKTVKSFFVLMALSSFFWMKFNLKNPSPLLKEKWGFLNPSHNLPPSKGIGELSSEGIITKWGRMSISKKGKLLKG
jgi:hypothetical protein